MLTDEQVADIRRLFHAEHWKIGTIAAHLGLHPQTVKTALQVERFHPEPGARRKLIDPYVDFIRQTLEHYPRLRATRIFEMIRSRGYTGGVIQVRRLVAGLRPLSREAFLRLSTLPGEQAQADWGHFGEVTIGRAKRRLSCFVLTLSYSRALWLEFFFDQYIESFLLGHIHAFEDWGGVPRNILYDNLRAVVLDRHRDAVKFHPRILELCAHYHFDPRPCRPARGNEKGRVERAIQYIRHSFFAARSFTTLEDFNRQAKLWRDTIAYGRPWPGGKERTVGSVVADEQPRLLPLPANRFDTDLIRPVHSDKTIYVRFDLNDYSIPHDFVGKPLVIAASQSQVRLLYGAEVIASHRRSFDRHQRIEDPAHVQALLNHKRKALGSAAGARLAHAVPAIDDFLDAAFARGELIAPLTRQLLQLLDDYGSNELAQAVGEALDRQTPTYASVAFILRRRRRISRHRPLPAVDLSRRPELEALSVQTHNLEVYDDFSKKKSSH
ncbi:MAG TPA: IS21 family transposase [Blastocatellia bacterium]|nr:IS21 family transposase [Blastocatellia bacterium]